MGHEAGPRQPPAGGRQVLSASPASVRSRVPQYSSRSRRRLGRARPHPGTQDLGRVQRATCRRSRRPIPTSTRCRTAGRRNGPLERNARTFVAPNFGTQAGWGFSHGLSWDEDARKFTYTGATDELHAISSSTSHRWWRTGCSTPKSVTQDDDTAIQKFGTGQSMSIGTNDQEIVRYRTDHRRARQPTLRSR